MSIYRRVGNCINKNSRIGKLTENSSVNQPHTLNLLGVTPLDFGPQTNVDIMKKNLQKYGWEVVSSWAMGDTL